MPGWKLDIMFCGVFSGLKAILGRFFGTFLFFLLYDFLLRVLVWVDFSKRVF